MKRFATGAATLLLAAAVPVVAAGQAQGAPQRGATVPPGLAKLLADPNRGILRAVIATMGSSSRLQDLPASP